MPPRIFYETEEREKREGEKSSIMQSTALFQKIRKLSTAFFPLCSPPPPDRSGAPNLLARFFPHRLPLRAIFSPPPAPPRAQSSPCPRRPKTPQNPNRDGRQSEEKKRQKFSMALKRKPARAAVASDPGGMFRSVSAFVVPLAVLSRRLEAVLPNAVRPICSR